MCSANRGSFLATFVVATILLSSNTVRADDPQPLSVTFGPDYVGYDGQWSPVQIRVGDPEQYLQVLPSTTSSENWVAGQTLCKGSTCASLRGGIFYNENSTTWQSLGQYEIGYSALSQSTDNANYGFDNISISDTVSTSDQVIALVDDSRHWIGQLGLGVKETRFQNDSNYLSFISTLVQNNSAIPSHSYGYTAGASYQGKGILGSLTLGGVDTSRYTPSNFWFTLASNYFPRVVVRSIEVTGSSVPMTWTTNPLQLMSQAQAATFILDSSTPFLWFPPAVCDNIAQALNLTWDPSVELYTFGDSSPQNLVNRDLQFTFDLADSTTTSEILSLKLSYAAFNLQLSYPFPGLPSNSSDTKLNYFPLRRANNTQQYTIGRAFLQETYLMVDYERNTFSLSQALFPDSSQQPQLAAITRPADSSWPGPNGVSLPHGLSTGAKIGIAIAVIFVVAGVIFSFWLYHRRRKQARDLPPDEKLTKSSLLSIFSRRSTRRSSMSEPASLTASELYADKSHPTEMTSDASNSRFELSAVAPVEMAAGEVPPNFFQQRANARVSQRNDPRSPVELVQPRDRSSVSKTGIEEGIRERAGSPAPAYSPSETNKRSSNSVSPYSPRNERNPFRSSSDNGISPVTGNGSDRGLLGTHLSIPGSDSDHLLSPVSPLPIRTDEQSSSYSGPENIGARQPSMRSDGVSRGSLSPYPSRSAAPVRSPSRDSRFKEDLIEQTGFTRSNQPSQNRESVKSSKQGGQARFSWE